MVAAKITKVVNPLWLRVWHTAQAVFFLGLWLTGLQMHYSDAGWVVIPFRWAVLAHNTFGVLSVVAWLWFVVMNSRTNNSHHYKSRRSGLLRFARQMRFYVYGMFVDEPPPFPPGFEDKFNPVQKLVYIAVMYVLLPLSILSGLVLLFPLLAPALALGVSGLFPVAMVHLVVSWLLAMFVVGHIYLATTGETVGSLYKEMLTGVRHSSWPPPPDRPRKTE